MSPSHRQAMNPLKCALILMQFKLSISRVVTNISPVWLWEWLWTKAGLDYTHIQWACTCVHRVAILGSCVILLLVKFCNCCSMVYGLICNVKERQELMSFLFGEGRKKSMHCFTMHFMSDVILYPPIVIENYPSMSCSSDDLALLLATTFRPLKSVVWE